MQYLAWTGFRAPHLGHLMVARDGLTTCSLTALLDASGLLFTATTPLRLQVTTRSALLSDGGAEGGMGMLKGYSRISPFERCSGPLSPGFAEWMTLVSHSSSSTQPSISSSYVVLTTSTFSMHFSSHLISLHSKSSRDSILRTPSTFSPRAEVFFLRFNVRLTLGGQHP